MRHSIKNMLAVHKINEVLIFNKSVYAGMCTLYLSKTLVYDFYYNYIKNIWGKS